MAEKKQIAAPSNVPLVFIVVCLVLYILHIASAIMIPFVLSVLVWYLINAIARGFGRFGLPRLLRFVLAILLLLGGLWFGYKMIAVNAGDVMRAAPVYQKKLTDFLPHLFEILPEAYRPSPADIAEYLNIGGLITVLVKTFSGIAGKTLVVLFYTGFLLYEQRFFLRKLHEMAGSTAAEARIHNLLQNIDGKIQRYIGVKTFLSLMIGLSTWAALTFFAVDFAAFWGVMAFLLNFIPYLGGVAAVLLPAVGALVQFGNPHLFLLLAGVLAVVQLTFAFYVDRKLMGDGLNLSPIFIIFSLALWAMVWGVPGMFLSVPILAMIVITLGEFDTTRRLAVFLSRTGQIARGDK